MKKYLVWISVILCGLFLLSGCASAPEAANTGAESSADETAGGESLSGSSSESSDSSEDSSQSSSEGSTIESSAPPESSESTEDKTSESSSEAVSESEPEHQILGEKTETATYILLTNNGYADIDSINFYTDSEDGPELLPEGEVFAEGEVRMLYLDPELASNGESVTLWMQFTDGYSYRIRSFPYQEITEGALTYCTDEYDYMYLVYSTALEQDISTMEEARENYLDYLSSLQPASTGGDAGGGETGGGETGGSDDNANDAGCVDDEIFN